MCDPERKSVNDYEIKFDALCRELAKQKHRVSIQVVDFVHWMLTDLRELERTLEIPAVKLAAEQAKENKKMSDQLEELRKSVNQLENRMPPIDDEEDLNEKMAGFHD
jgi:uncharacterized protein YigA (DUF484 family)